MKNTRRRIRNIVSTILAAGFFCVATGVPAQTVHWNVDPEGRITVSDLPDATPAPPPEAVPAEEPPRVRRSTISPRRAAVVEANEAERRLRQARLARERGAEPHASERVRGAGTVSHRYWQRQEKLRLEAEQALRRSNETRRSLHASR